MSMANLPKLPFFERAHAAATKNSDKPAIIDGRTGKCHTYADLLRDANAFKAKLLTNGEQDLKEARVAALIPNGCKLGLVSGPWH